jgi:hypothetical protein
MTPVQRVGVIAGLPRAVVATGPRRRTLLAAAVVAVVLAGSAMLSLGGSETPAPAATPADRMVLPAGPEPSPPVSLLPPPAGTTSPVATPSSAPARRSLSAGTRRPAPTRTSPSPRAPVALSVGSTTGLEILGRPGDRLRHRDFRARIDRITAGSSALDKADSTFAVRTGLASRGCVSLEAVNYPGYFLRHRDFVLRLERRDRSTLFARDATFCPEPGRGGTALVLKALNYPDRALSAGSGSVRLSTSDPTAFVPVAP